METITLEEFKKLVPADSPDRKEAFGKFGVSTKTQKTQCENLKVGDKVFYLDTKDSGLDEAAIPQVDIVLTQALVVQ